MSTNYPRQIRKIQFKLTELKQCYRKAALAQDKHTNAPVMIDLVIALSQVLCEITEKLESPVYIIDTDSLKVPADGELQPGELQAQSENTCGFWPDTPANLRAMVENQKGTVAALSKDLAEMRQKLATTEKNLQEERQKNSQVRRCVLDLLSNEGRSDPSNLIAFSTADLVGLIAQTMSGLRTSIDNAHKYMDECGLISRRDQSHQGLTNRVRSIIKRAVDRKHVETAHVDGTQPLRDMLWTVHARLRSMAEKAATGGWSTIHIQPMRELADKILTVLCK